MQNEKSFDTGELTLSYLDSGTSGAPLVLLHGLTANKFDWKPLLPDLASRGHVYALDLRGHGKSGRAPDNQYLNVDYARDVISFLKHLGDPAVLMGHSQGAMAAIVTASEYQGLRALVLLDPPLFSYSASVELRPEAAHWFGLVASIMHDNPSYETVVARLRERMPDAPDEQVAGMAGTIVHIAPGAVEAALQGTQWQGVDLPSALQQIACPTLLVHADWNSGGVMRAEDIEMFKTNCPSATVVGIPGANHGLKMQEQPDIVLDPVRAFLQSV